MLRNRRYTHRAARLLATVAIPVSTRRSAQACASTFRWPSDDITSAHNPTNPAQKKTICTCRLAALALDATELTRIGLTTSV